MKTFLYIITIFLILSSSSAQWTRQVLPFPYNGSYWLDVYFLPNDSLYGWVCGAATDPPMASQDGAVLRTTDGGKTWAGVTLNNTQMLESVHFLNRRVGYTSGTGGIFKSVDGGATWNEVTPEGDTTGWGCHFVNENVGVYVGGGCGNEKQQFYRTSDGGNSWSLYETFTPESGLTDPLLLEENGLGYASSSGIIWRTSNGGRTWEPWVSTGQRYWQEEITNFGESFLVPTSGSGCAGGGTGGQLRFTTDGGNSWTRFNTGANMFGTFLLNAKTGWGCGYGAKVLYTSDAGENWRPFDCGVEPTDDLDDIFFINNDWGWVVGRHIYEFRRVAPMPIRIIISRQMPVCEGDTVILTAEPGFENYRWSNGKFGDEIIVTTGGEYTVDAYQRSNCTEVQAKVSVTIFPKQNPKVLLTGRTVLCDNDTSLISMGDWIRFNPVWSNGSREKELRVWDSGIYWFSGIDSNGCAFVSDTLRFIKKQPIKPQIIPLAKIAFCTGDSTILTATDGFARYEWSNGEKTQRVVIKERGKYIVKAYDADGCNGTSDSIEISVYNINNNLTFDLLSDRNAVVFDSVLSRKIYCKTIRVKNNAQYSITPLPYLIHNVSFSIPPSQFPLVIAPNEEKNLTLCFTADTIGFHTDTLIVEDTCRPNRVALMSSVKILGDTVFRSQCDIPLHVRMTRAGNSYYIAPPYPNPSNDAFTVSITPTIVNSSEDIQIKVYDCYGILVYSDVRSFFCNQSTELLSAQSEEIWTKGWARGRYTVILHFENEAVYYPVYLY